MSVFVYKLIVPRASFAQDMTARERAVMSEHVAFWSGLAAEGAALVFGPVGDPAGFWGLGVVRAESIEAARELTAADPAVVSGVARCEIHPMPQAIVGTAGPVAA